MTTPNIKTWQYRVKVNGTWQGDAMKLEIDDLRAALQSQAERIKELEAEQSDLDVAYTDQVLRAMSAEAERDELRAELAAIAATEPVAWAISYDGTTPYTLWHEGDGPLLDGEVKRQGGTTRKMPLFTRPMPAQDVSELVDALKDTAQTLLWLTYGKCRGFSDRLLTEEDALDNARKALSKYKGSNK